MGHGPETDRRIRERAFHIWIEEGKPEGRDKEHWLQAEAELVSGTSPPLQPGQPLVDKGEGQAPAPAGGDNRDDNRR